MPLTPAPLQLFRVRQDNTRIVALVMARSPVEALALVIEAIQEGGFLHASGWIDLHTADGEPVFEPDLALYPLRIEEDPEATEALPALPLVPAPATDFQRPHIIRVTMVSVHARDLVRSWPLQEREISGAIRSLLMDFFDLPVPEDVQTRLEHLARDLLGSQS